MNPETFPIHFGIIPFEQVSKRPLTGAQTVLITCFPYYYRKLNGQNLARFAALPDYHEVVTQTLETYAEALRTAYPQNFFRTFADNSPIDEKKAALESGLCDIGMNTLALSPDYGSFFFLGEIITDRYFAPTQSKVQCCLHCGACVRACPSGALSEQGFQVDRCISHLTQKKGELTEEDTALIRKGQSAWGCDICQEVCPLNRDLQEANFGTPLPPLTAKDLEPLTNAEFRQRYAHFPFTWRGKAPLLRNLYLLEES